MYRTGMFACALFVLTATVAFGQGKSNDKKGGASTVAPEIDPSAAVSALALVSGSLLVFKNRRK